ncbi:hypothetical protein AcV7_004770 [Taiwanofungus camphoratus]|nr:hypothetical protein AcV7_004770 [Antrodia cinnamomea]
MRASEPPSLEEAEQKFIQWKRHIDDPGCKPVSLPSTPRLNRWMYLLASTGAVVALTCSLSISLWPLKLYFRRLNPGSLRTLTMVDTSSGHRSQCQRIMAVFMSLSNRVQLLDLELF